MAALEKPGRTRQKLRTRKDLLQAAARLMKDGRKPSFDEIAEEAQVSRATAYRYFPGVEAMLIEAALDVAAPDAERLLGPGAPADPLARALLVDKGFHDLFLANEVPLRAFVANAMQRTDEDTPHRQNRRAPLIDAALKPLADRLPTKALDRLAKSLGIVIGTEAMIAFKDVLRVSDGEARTIKTWMIEALIKAALAERR